MEAKELRRIIKEVAKRLENHYGQVAWQSNTDPVAVLIETILSHSTTDHNRDLAFGALQAAYPDWQAVIEAPVEDLARVIRPAGLHRQKAGRIQTVLRSLLEQHGEFTLDYLAPLTVEESLEALMRFSGVGKKTAGIVLTFALDKPYFPVDTHINRITQRLGWVETKEDPHDVLNATVPEGLKYVLHLHLIQHGRDTCKARKPRCEQCVLNDLCPVGKFV